MTGSLGTFPTSDHLALLLKAQEALNRVAPLVGKAEACGIDCTEYREGISYMGDKINRFRSEFFPDAIVPPDGSGVPRHD